MDASRLRLEPLCSSKSRLLLVKTGEVVLGLWPVLLDHLNLVEEVLFLDSLRRVVHLRILVLKLKLFSDQQSFLPLVLDDFNSLVSLGLHVVSFSDIVLYSIVDVKGCLADLFEFWTLEDVYHVHQGKGKVLVLVGEVLVDQLDTVADEESLSFYLKIGVTAWSKALAVSEQIGQVIIFKKLHAAVG